MDELVTTFDTSLVSEQQSNESNFKDRYKKTGLLDNQEQRRKELLEEQKLGRQRQIDGVRGIKELVDNEQDHIFKKRAHYKPSIYVAGFNKTTYRNILMLSEWMIEKPEDFNNLWFMTPCPKGVRVLVIASKGKTKFFTKYGRFQFQASTLLPGGNTEGRRAACTILDGVYDEKGNTLHVLDVLAWNNQTMTGCDADFRFFWLENQIKETPNYAKITNYNEVIISVTPKVLCLQDDLNCALMKYPPFPDNHPELDGFLFYHKHAQYVPGETPLAGWLFPYMIREVLGSDITINPEYETSKPSDYVNQADFIEKFTVKQEQKLRHQMNRARRYQQKGCKRRCRCKCNKSYKTQCYYLNPYGDEFFEEIYSEDIYYVRGAIQYSESDCGDKMEADDTEKAEGTEQMEAEVQQNMEEEVIEPPQNGFPKRKKERQHRRNLRRAARKMAAEGSQTMETEGSEKAGSGESQNQSVESMESEQVSQETVQDTTQETMQDTTQESIEDNIQQTAQEITQETTQGITRETTPGTSQADS